MRKEQRQLSTGWDARVIDDVWSVIFVFIDLVVGCLPWSAAVRSRDKAAVGACKAHMCCAALQVNGDAAAIGDSAAAIPPKRGRRPNTKGKKKPAVSTNNASKPLNIIAWIIEKLDSQEVRRNHENPFYNNYNSLIVNVRSFACS
jgi:hypothetical protein